MSMDIITQSMASAMVVKVVIDIFRYFCKVQQVEYPAWTFPILSIFLGVAICAIMAVANGQQITLQACAQFVIGGVLAAGQAIGVTELQKRG